MSSTSQFFNALFLVIVDSSTVVGLFELKHQLWMMTLMRNTTLFYMQWFVNEGHVVLPFLMLDIYIYIYSLKKGRDWTSLLSISRDVIFQVRRFPWLWGWQLLNDFTCTSVFIVILSRADSRFSAAVKQRNIQQGRSHLSCWWLYVVQIRKLKEDW